MRLEEQVANLELSQKLKKLGVKQESLWWWGKRKYHDTLDKCEILPSWQVKKPNIFPLCSAFTVAELGEILPKWIYTIRLDYEPYDKCWCVLGKNGMIEITANTEANARAKMLIWLIENKHISNYKQEE